MFEFTALQGLAFSLDFAAFKGGSEHDLASLVTVASA